MSWLDADDDDEEDDDYQLPEGISEGWRRGPMVPPRRVFKVGDLAPALSPVQTGLGSNLSPEAGLQSPTRPKAKPFRDSDKTTQERDDMYEVEELRDFLFPRIHQFHTISNLFFDLSINQIQDSQLQPDLSKEKQECTRRSLKHKPLHTKLFEELSKGQFPFDWSKRNGGALGGNKGSMATQRRREKELQHSTEDEVLSLDLTVAATDSNTVLSSELKRNDKNVKIPTVTQANGIQGCKTKNVQQSHKEFTDGTPETHAFSSKTHNGLCSSLSIPSNQKLHSYHNPLQGASASFIHRLTEIAGLECDTIRQEKIRKLKKRSDC
ncbi:uncharacterized protein si:ch211-171b20.3 isoform X5 [Chiloscyllium plagiosum]|uniref:uncharacterized protein si:ch211-171b20.3 isoform X5 n=1 Tax=Chiloscyllium plagiosum TaxID=36176 RepID=UPI001CB86DC8|nr:uncharacterized protein si:ch211-171b20.3 isoform X5 [Chiloscyllium plagiosum]